MPKREQKKQQDRDGVYQRLDSPIWWASYSDGRGGTTRRSTGVSVAADPEGLRARQVRASWIAGDQVERTGSGSTFDDLLALYLDQVTPTKRSPDRDRWSARALYPAFTGRRLDDIRAPEVRAYIQGRTPEGIAPGTVNKEVGLMSAAINWARKELEWAVDNPWQSRRMTEPAGHDRWLTHDEADRLLSAAADRSARYPWLEDFIRIGLNTGMRPGEILGLEWDRVSFDGSVISFGIGDQKSNRRGRIPANADARATLQRRRQYRAEHCPGSPWVICRRDGSRIASVTKGFAGCVADAGLEDVHPHDLRRTCGSWLTQAGVGIERVSAILRHADVARSRLGSTLICVLLTWRMRSRSWSSLHATLHARDKSDSPARKSRSEAADLYREIWSG
ncbi:tyrosine-type recombinase/integrase [Thiocystis violacea]|uniref:tyrosine-type recombinase/integrase n=1 Tax=Thiocystis violacea TaxID=13725 RepID=UPI001F5B306F|nr:site-specific integrase [Thiocystis violacea]